MPTPRLTDAECLAALDLLREHGSNKDAVAANPFGWDDNQLRRRLHAARARGLDGLPPAGFEVAGVTVNKDGEAVSTRYRPAHGTPFEVPAGFGLAKTTVEVDADGRLVRKWDRFSPEGSRLDDFLACVREALTDLPPLAPLAPPIQADESLCTVLPIADAHVGQMSWGRETGENYNIQLAGRVLLELASEMIGAAPVSDTFIVLVLGDYFHMNDETARTPRGQHALDTDGRYMKVLREGVRYLATVVRMAACRHRNVIVRVLPGNHDPEMAKAAAVALEMRFEDEPRVTVDMDPSDWWFMPWGESVLLGANHGHEVKLDDMSGVMAQAVPRLWARPHRFMFSGHVHHFRGKDKLGVRVESFPAVTARDAYASKHGYFSARGMEALTFHATDGLRGRVSRFIPAATMEAA